MIVPTDATGGWRFCHPLIHDAAYRSLLATDRTILHTPGRRPDRGAPAGPARRDDRPAPGGRRRFRPGDPAPAPRRRAWPPAWPPRPRRRTISRRPPGSSPIRRSPRSCGGGPPRHAGWRWSGRTGRKATDRDGRGPRAQVRRACADSWAACGSDAPTAADPWPTSMRRPGRPAWAPGRAAQAASIRARSSSRKWTSTTFRAPA